MATEVELGEVFRLAEAANLGQIVADTGDRLAGMWLAVSRFQDVQALMTRSLKVQTSPSTLLLAGRGFDATGNRASALDYYQQALPITREVGDRYGEATSLNNIGAVHNSLGDRASALDYYQQALVIRREVGDRAGEAVTLNNIGMVHDNLGDRPTALGYFQQALPILRDVGDRAGEAVTRYNIAMVHRANKHLTAAVAELEQVVVLDRAVNHPDLTDDTAMLQQVRAELSPSSSSSSDNAAGAPGSQ